MSRDSTSRSAPAARPSQGGPAARAATERLCRPTRVPRALDVVVDGDSTDALERAAPRKLAAGRRRSVDHPRRARLARAALTLLRRDAPLRTRATWSRAPGSCRRPTDSRTRSPTAPQPSSSASGAGTGRRASRGRRHHSRRFASRHRSGWMPRTPTSSARPSARGRPALVVTFFDPKTPGWYTAARRPQDLPHVRRAHGRDRALHARPVPLVRRDAADPTTRYLHLDGFLPASSGPIHATAALPFPVRPRSSVDRAAVS